MEIKYVRDMYGERGSAYAIDFGTHLGGICEPRLEDGKLILHEDDYTELACAIYKDNREQLLDIYEPDYNFALDGSEERKAELEEAAAAK